MFTSLLENLKSSPFFMLVLGPGLGTVAITFIVFIIEIICVGWAASSLLNLKKNRSNSALNDFFYFLLGVTGLRGALGIVLTLGLGYFFSNWVEAHFSVALLSNQTFLVSFLIVLIVNSFVYYLTHRTMHSSFFWELHKVHHVSEEFNIITGQRNHPIDSVVGGIFSCLPAALLGAPFEVSIAYLIFYGFHQSFLHSRIDSGWGWLGRYIIVSPRAHRIHHSREAKHFGRNLGFLIVWDKLFGTWYEPEADQVISLGLENEPLHNTGNPVREMFQVFLNWVKSFRVLK